LHGVGPYTPVEAPRETAAVVAEATTAAG
jgi:hypothetical protein